MTKTRSGPALRKQRQRSRERAGIVIVSIELPVAFIAHAIDAGLISEPAASNRAAVAELVSRIVLAAVTRPFSYHFHIRVT